MSEPMLFSPITFKNMTAKNRIAMAPMCMFIAGDDGFPNLFHEQHYVSRAAGGTGMIIMEAIAVVPDGRISDRDLGLWDDKFIEPLANIVKKCQFFGAKVGVQLNHAGAKSECVGLPWGVSHTDLEGYPEIHEMTEDDCMLMAKAFADAADRANRAGFDFIEIHGAHGYLINQFMSPASNWRKDRFGNPTEFLSEVLNAMEGVWPAEKPIFLRISGTDHDPRGNTPAIHIKNLTPFKDKLDLIHVSTGGVVRTAPIKVFSGYQVPYCEEIRKGLGLPTAAVGLLQDPYMAEEILMNGRADVIALGRPLLHDPYWPLHAAYTLGYDIEWPSSTLQKAMQKFLPYSRK